MIGLAMALVLGSGDIRACVVTAGDYLRTEKSVLPAVSTEAVAEVGEPLIQASVTDLFDGGVKLEEPVVLSGPWSGSRFTLTVPAGELRRVFVGGRFLNVPSSYDFVLDGGSSPRRRPSIDFVREGGALVGVVDSGFSRTPHAVAAQHSVIECGDGAKTFRRILSYSGVSRGVVTLEYREFSGDLARPAFTQSATYDLAEGREIAFRGARLEILSADNISVRYRVLKPFD